MMKSSLTILKSNLLTYQGSINQKLLKLLYCSGICVGGVLALPGSGMAQHAYIRQGIAPYSIINSEARGGRFKTNKGQEDLINPGSNATVANRDKFIVKTMWLIGRAANGDDEWVEVGSLKGWTAQDGGSTNTSYWAGHYYARQKVVNGIKSYFRVYSNPR